MTSNKLVTILEFLGIVWFILIVVFIYRVIVGQ